MHWFSFQIMIFVHITYWLNPTYDPVEPGTKILKKMHYYVSDEKKHDTIFVQNVFQLNWEFLQERGCYPKKMRCGAMGVASSSKMQNVGIFYLDTII